MTMTEGKEMKCPICQMAVTKVNISDSENKDSIECINEYYLHYVTKAGKHKLNRFTHPHTSEPEIRFKQ